MQKVKLTRSNPALPIFFFGAAVLALGAGAAAGCTGPATLPDDASGSTGTGTGTAGGGGSGGSITVQTPDEAYEFYLVADAKLQTACAGCHSSSAATEDPFLDGTTPEARYQRLITWNDFVKKDWASSLLLAYPNAGAVHPGEGTTHSGKNYGEPGTEGLKDALEDWLQAESSLIVETTNPLGVGTEPFTPIMGLNAIYFDDIDPQLAGVLVTFMATELSSTILELTDITVYTPANTGVTIDAPRFVIYPAGAAAEDAVLNNVDAWSNVKVDVDANQTQILSTGLALLTGWVADAKLAIYFKDLKPFISMGGGMAGGCNAGQSFTDNAAGRFRTSCASNACHGGATSNARNALDMRGLTMNTPEGDATACAQIRNKVNLTTPADSIVFVNTNPNGGTNHDFQFGGNAANWQAFRDGVSVWITEEAAASAGQ